MPDLITPTLAPVPTVPTVPIPTAQSVYGAPNLIQTATAPVQAPNPILNDYNAFINTPEMIAARTGVSTIQQQINSERAGLRNTTTGLEYQNDQALGTTGASINLIGRQVGRASELSSNRQAALGEQYSAASAYLQGLESTQREKFGIVQAEKQRIQSLIAQTGNKAGIKTTDSFEIATEKAYNWNKKEQKKAEKKSKEETDKKEKDQLKTLVAKLGGSTNTKKGGSLSAKELKKEYERLSGNEYKKASSRDDQAWNMKVASFNKSMAGGNNGSKISTLLTKAAGMTSGGADWAKKNASLYGLKESDVTPYLQGNWGDGFREEPRKPISKPHIPKGAPVNEGGEVWQYYEDGQRTNIKTGVTQIWE